MGVDFNDIRIPVTVGGVTFKNPFYVASGPTTKSVRQLLRIEETGWAGASIKLSIDPAPYINRKPRYSLFRDRNALAFTAEKRLTFAEGLRLIEEARPKLHDLVLMANITYAGDDGVEGWVNMARRFQEAGADIIELNMCCPNMSYNLELTSGGAQTAARQTGASMGQHADVASEIVRAIKGEISIPLFVKLTPEGGQIAHVAKALFEAGADAVGGTANRLGMPPIDLEDPGRAYYHLQEEISMGCHCGPWLKPLAQRDTYEIRKVCGMAPDVTATGGIANWRDAVEMILCGGTLLGVCAETLISGYDIVRPMIRGLSDYMQAHGYADLSQMRGLVVPEVRTATDVTLHAGYARIKAPNLSAPCKSACPHHVPVQAYVQKIARRDYRAAYDLITSASALQGLCALACTHPCEDACVRAGVDAPVKIRALKRFVLEYGRALGWKPAGAAEANGLRVAVVGAGPRGLSCAAELARAGYGVTVFEKEAKAGGLLRHAAPEYACDPAALDREVGALEALGVRLECGKALGRDFTAADLKRAGFAAMFIATGAAEVQPLGLPGEELAVDALAFLRALREGRRPPLNGRVAVVGADFAAVEAARSIRRLGADRVALIWTDARPRGGWFREALQLAREEGVSVIEGARPLEVLADGLRLDRDGAELTLLCGAVLLAHPRAAKASEGGEAAGLFIQADDGLTGRDGIIDAITAGRNAAAAIDRELRGDSAALAPVAPVRTVSVEGVRARHGYIKKDAHPLKLEGAPEVRMADFAPHSRAMTEEEAVREAQRCLNCGCGEGCQLCKTICCDFAPQIVGPDRLAIDPEACVACGMCFNRCPNGNIEMVDLGEKV